MLVAMPTPRPVIGETAAYSALLNADPVSLMTAAVLLFRETSTAKIATPTIATATVTTCSVALFISIAFLLLEFA